MGIPDHLTCLLRNLYAGQEATVRTENNKSSVICTLYKNIWVVEKEIFVCHESSIPKVWLKTTKKKKDFVSKTKKLSNELLVLWFIS